jgi:hypothetical protein
MGTAKIQGELWGAKARDWVELQEPAWRPVYEAVLARAGIASGCRARALKLARWRRCRSRMRPSISSAGAVVRAIRHAGEPAVRNAVVDTLGPFTLANGSVRQRNRFHWVTATPAAAA